MAYSRCPMLTQSAPSLAAFRAAWFTTVLMSAPKTARKMDITKQNQTKKLLLNCTNTNHPLETTLTYNIPKTDHYSEISISTEH